MSNLRTKQQGQDDIASMSAGLKKRLAGEVLWLAGTKVATADVIATLDAYASAVRAADSARTMWSDLLGKVRAQKPRIRSLLANLHDALYVMFGASSAALGDFGMRPRKKKKSTAEVKLAGQQKAKATRKARNTMGKKQKAKIRGVVKPA